MNFAKYDYNSMVIIVREDRDPPVLVYAQGRASRDGVLFETTSLDQAMRWIDERVSRSKRNRAYDCLERPL